MSPPWRGEREEQNRERSEKSRGEKEKEKESDSKGRYAAAAAAWSCGCAAAAALRGGVGGGVECGGASDKSCTRGARYGGRQKGEGGSEENEDSQERQCSRRMPPKWFRIQTARG